MNESLYKWKFNQARWLNMQAILSIIHMKFRHRERMGKE